MFLQIIATLCGVSSSKQKKEALTKMAILRFYSTNAFHSSKISKLLALLKEVILLIKLNSF